MDASSANSFNAIAVSINDRIGDPSNHINNADWDNLIPFHDTDDNF
ncbi:MAG: hypothetical protein AB9Q22_02695 [Candidatus Reddybacter sp.]